jgi:hypothetical protein
LGSPIKRLGILGFWIIHKKVGPFKCGIRNADFSNFHTIARIIPHHLFDPFDGPNPWPSGGGVEGLVYPVLFVLEFFKITV